MTPSLPTIQPDDIAEAENSDTEPSHVVFQPELVVRESTAG